MLLPGSRFARHIDNTTQDGRRLTMLVYLNPSWSPDMGGALRLTPPKASVGAEEEGKGGEGGASAGGKRGGEGGEESGGEGGSAGGSAPGGSADAIDIFPKAGRLALFYSATIPHEVGREDYELLRIRIA